MHTTKVPPLCDGLVKPAHNVATVELSAVVIEGISRSRNALLNGDTEHYDWEQGYTCHQLGSGAIVVQLAQPYLLSSIRILLWDCDYRHYSYYVETSLNYWDWETVCDRTRDHCRSWQVIYFSPRPVSIIRIVGTNNSVNEVFHLVHLECPAQVEEPREDATTKKQRQSPQDNRLNPSNGPGSSASEASGRAASPCSSDASEPRLPPAETATEAEERYPD
ncbi:hypothetical protein evm_012027 [Chilo suppressalis]|nr:hypothetical protein evm_012027 [Chilo suppressalis]